MSVARHNSHGSFKANAHGEADGNVADPVGQQNYAREHQCGA
jgi:hypothetical protein